MKRKEAYNKIFAAHDLLWEVLENILYKERKETPEINKLIELLETAVDQTGAARNMLEEAQS